MIFVRKNNFILKKRVFSIKHKNNFIFKTTFFLILFYGSIYGLVTLYADNLFTRATKDVLLILLIAYSFFILLIKKYISKKNMFSLVFFIICVIVIGGSNPIAHGNLASFVYGLKITMFPLLLVFSGILMNNYGLKLNKILFFVFITITTTWVIQYNQGVDALVAMGWEYGIQVKNFNHATPRLPSSVGTPDGYAFLLCIIGILLEYSPMFKDKKKRKFIIKVATLTFLILATIRSALVFWLVFQLLMSFYYVKKLKGRVKYLVLSLYCMIASSIPLAIFYLSSSSLSSTSSLEDRFSHWGVHLPPIWSLEGLVGSGLGSVGAASRRTATLGYQSSNYAVDNQFIAFYEQLGLIGTFCVLSVFSIILYMVIYNVKKNDSLNAKVALSLMVCTFISGFFTNVLELYPFNLFLWIYVGAALYKIPQYEQNELEKEFIVKKRRKKWKKIVW
jgi:hypothetical protein